MTLERKEQFPLAGSGPSGSGGSKSPETQVTEGSPPLPSPEDPSPQDVSASPMSTSTTSTTNGEEEGKDSGLKSTSTSTLTDTDTIEGEIPSLQVGGMQPFPEAEMARLDEMISNPRWVVPVLPGGQLEVLLEAAINLARNGLDEDCVPCQRFIREGLTTSFTKILTDDAVSSWKPDIHKCIYRNSERLVELIVLKMGSDNVHLLDLLGIIFNPGNKFHGHNSSRQPESVCGEGGEGEEVYSRPSEMRMVKGMGWNTFYNEECY